MAFAWYGICLPLDDDWAPVSLSGAKESGYCRLASSRNYQIQLRWETARTPEALPKAVEKYLRKVQRDQKKAKFDSQIEILHGERLHYQFEGRNSARGLALFCSERNLAVLVECSAAGKTGLTAAFQKLAAQVQVENAPFLSWELLGLRSKIPAKLPLVKRTFLAGRTSLEFGHKYLPLIRAERWGLAEALLAKYPLEEWAKSALRMPKAKHEAFENGIVLRDRPWVYGARTALIQVDREANNIQTITSFSTRADYTPTWEWLER